VCVFVSVSVCECGCVGGGVRWRIEPNFADMSEVLKAASIGSDVILHPTSLHYSCSEMK
jgi:iron only hydrogenase large subunit-like protein